MLEPWPVQATAAVFDLTVLQRRYSCYTMPVQNARACAWPCALLYPPSGCILPQFVVTCACARPMLSSSYTTAFTNNNCTSKTESREV